MVNGATRNSVLIPKILLPLGSTATSTGPTSQVLPIRTEFSWYCDGNLDMLWVTYKDGTIIMQNMTPWRDSIHTAIFVMNDKWKIDPTDGATFYYNPNIANPSWAGKYKETAIFGNHRFMICE